MDPTVTERLRALHEEGRVEVQWLTTRAEKADEFLAGPMRLPHGLWVHARPGVESTGFVGQLRSISGWWRLAAAMAVAQEEPGRRIVWIDDDLAEQAGCPAPSEEGAGATEWNGQRAPTLRQ